jgi:hypothetical protein
MTTQVSYPGSDPVVSSLYGQANRYNTSYGYVYAYLRDRISAVEDSVKTTPNFHREYVEDLKRILKKNLYVITPEGQVVNDIEVMYDSSDRAIAALEKHKNLKLPIVSYGIDDLISSNTRRKPNFNYRNYEFYDPVTRKATRVIGMASKAIDLIVRVTIFTKYTEDMNQLVEQMELLFHPFLTLKTEFGNSTTALLLDWTEESIKMAADRQDRVLMKSCIISVEGNIPEKLYLITSSEKIKSIHTDISLSS